MKINSLVLAIALSVVGGILPVEASAQHGHRANTVSRHQSRDNRQQPQWQRYQPRRGHRAPNVPELDPNAAAPAFALLIGATALMLDRRRRAV